MTSSTPKGRPALAFIFITVTLDSLGIGIILPVMPDLIASLTGEGISTAARWGGALVFVYAVAQFIFNPVLGALSDAFGRRPVLLFSLGAYAIDYLIMALAPTLAVLFIGRALAGVFGATFSTANAYIADITPKEQRAARFGMVGAAFGVGFIFGPVIGGLMGEISPRAPFFIAAAFAAINCLYGYFVVPETLNAKNRRPFEWGRAHPFGALKSVIRFPMLAGLLIALFAYEISHYVYPAVWSYYAQQAFDWSPAEVGYSLAAVGLGFVIAQGLLIKPILGRFGSERTLIMTLICNIFVLIALGFITTGWMVYTLLPFSALGAIAAPALKGILSSQVDATMQGELQGVMGSIMSVAVIVSPVVMTQVFAAFSEPGAPVYLPGAPFLVAAVLMAVTLVIVLKQLRN